MCELLDHYENIMLLYIHFPFCLSKCHYCAFHSTVPVEGEIERYTGLVLHEIDYWGDRLGRVNLNSLYFGGGTPSLLPLPQFEAILKSLHQRFRLAPTCESTLEANPDSAQDVDYLKSLVALGMNRISLGVQSLNDECLKAIGRRHTRKQALEAVHHVRQAGFNNLNLDFIWGLPGQNIQSWMKQLELLARLKPEHLSCYGLSIEPGTVFAKIHAQNQLSLPPESEQAKMFIHGAEYLEAQGFLHYEISNFSRLGFACRHNQGYWEGFDYLGLGPAAVSTVKGRRWENPKSLSVYALALDQDLLGEEAEELTPAVQARERVMLALRTTRGLNLKKYQKMTGRNFLTTHAGLIHTLRQNNLARLSRGYFRFTKNGLLVSSSILERLLERE